MQEIRIILIGRSGHGKSATGNTILKEQKFKTCVSSTAVTSQTSLQEANYNNYNLKVIDTPGYFDIKSPDEEMYEWLKTETMKSIALSVPGPHAFLYVLKAGRFTEEDIQSLKALLLIFGPRMKEHMIFVFTYFNEIKDEYNLLDDYIINLPPVLSEILNDCGNRVLAIDNRNGSEEEKFEFLRLLLTTIETMDGKYYTNDALNEATSTIDKKVTEIMETKNISKDSAFKAVFIDIQTGGTFFKVLKEHKYSLLATFASTVIPVWFIGAPGLAFGAGVFAITTRCQIPECKPNKKCRIM